jgi:hypothetical protein
MATAIRFHEPGGPPALAVYIAGPLDLQSRRTSGSFILIPQGTHHAN